MADKGSAALYKRADLGHEFGGVGGVAFIMVMSHLAVLGLHTYLSAGPDDESSHLWPTQRGATLYLGFVAVSALVAVAVPGGVQIKGLPLPALNGKSLVYNCNGFIAWWSLIALLAVLHSTGVLRLQVWAENIGPMVIVSGIVGNAIAFGVYAATRLRGKMESPTGIPIIDVFMGVTLNPRLTLLPGMPQLDLKFWSELRVPWCVSVCACVRWCVRVCALVCALACV